jgi:hypothetical protein
MMTTDPIDQLVNALPERNVTTAILGALDFVVPGEWENVTGWEATIRDVTG